MLIHLFGNLAAAQIFFVRLISKLQHSKVTILANHSFDCGSCCEIVKVSFIFRITSFHFGDSGKEQ